MLSIKKSERIGLSELYYIEKSFSEFEAVFNYLNEFYKPVFLKSKYAKELIFRDDFIVYGFINIGIEIFRDLITLSNEDKFQELVEKAKRNGEDVFIKETKEMIENMKIN
jgi:hypothetical protein